MKLHLRFDSYNLVHSRMTLFIDGQNSGNLCMSPAQAVWFAHILHEGTTILSPKGENALTLVTSGTCPKTTEEEMHHEIQKP